MKPQSNEYHARADQFRDLRPAEAAERCKRFAGMLLRKGVRRCAKERLQLAVDVADLLMHVRRFLAGYRTEPSRPMAQPTQDGKVTSGFMRWNREAGAAQRATAIERAASLVLGTSAAEFLDEKVRGQNGRAVSRFEFARGNDDHLEKCLLELDDMVDDAKTLSSTMADAKLR